MTIGILGGMGSYATLYCFKKILDKTKAANESDYPHIIIDNNPKLPSRVRAILYDEKKDELLRGLVKGIQNLSWHGADKILIPCNTAHYFYEDICHALPELDILNMVQIAKDACKGYKRIGVLASEGTIAAKIYGEDVIYPDESRWPVLRSIIEDVKRNEITNRTIDNLISEICRLDSDCVILACTEFSVIKDLFATGMANKPVIDSLETAIRALA